MQGDDTQVQPQRITIERETDWLRVQGNVNDALTRAMEARLSTLPGGSRGDVAKKVRPLLEEKLNKIREQMWNLTIPNLRVNGFEYEKFVDTTEPFDEALDSKLWALNTERVRWESQVAEKRRDQAGQVADLLADLEERRDAAMWDPSEQDRAKAAALESGKKHINPEDIPPPPRHDQVLKTFSNVVNHFSELASSAPQQLSRAERVNVVQQELSRLPS